MVSKMKLFETVEPVKCNTFAITVPAVGYYKTPRNTIQAKINQTVYITINKQVSSNNTQFYYCTVSSNTRRLTIKDIFNHMYII